MQLKKALKDKNLDIRVRDRLIAEGKVTVKELEKSHKELEDLKEKLVESKVELKTR